MSNSLEQLKAAGTVSRFPVPGGGTGNRASVETVVVRWRAEPDIVPLRESKLANAFCDYIDCCQ